MVELKIIDHKKYSLSERENYIQQLVPSIKNDAVFLQTCNRVEVYHGSGYVSREIVHHLFRVVCGLESRLIGETSIQGQIKKSYQWACQNNSLNKSLHRLFQTALHVGKKVRSETNISKGAMSHSHAAVNMINKHCSDLKDKTVTLLGAHNFNEGILQYIWKMGAISIFIGNRNYLKAEELANKYKCYAFRFDELKSLLSRTDILISATSAPHVVVKAKDIPTNHPMLILDLAVPRDIEESAKMLPDVELYNLEEVENEILANKLSRKHEIRDAEIIIESEVEKFLNWQINQIIYEPKEVEHIIEI